MSISLMWLLDGIAAVPANEVRDIRDITLDSREVRAGSLFFALPGRSVRVRLACAWPVLIGIRTLARLRASNPLDPQQRIKISRSEVKSVIVRSVLFYPCPPAWRNLFAAANG